MSKIILCDTREQENKFILEAFKKNNIEYKITKLNVGDYAIEQNGLIPNIVIERKGSITELIGNLTDNKSNKQGQNRFIRELEKCYKSNIRLYIIIECSEGDLYNSIMRKQYRNNIEPKQVLNWFMSLEYKYPNLKILGCRKELFASCIVNTLNYGAKRLTETKII